MSGAEDLPSNQNQENADPQDQAINLQQATPGGGVGQPKNPSLIASAVPPRGLDPALHNRDTTATLFAVSKSLESSGSEGPKVLKPHSGGANSAHPADQTKGGSLSTSTVSSNDVASGGRVNASGTGKSEINESIVTSDFLAAAAEKFYTSSAEDIVRLITG